MIIVMQPGATEENIRSVMRYIESYNLRPQLSRGEEVTVIGVIGDKSRLDSQALIRREDVSRIIPVTESYRLANLRYHTSPSSVSAGNTTIGPRSFTVIAGPCAVENRQQLMEIARAVRAAGATCLRGGAYKPRTSPYAFQGLEEEGLRYMQEAGKETGLTTISEVINARSLETAVRYVDILQIGSRNMQNYDLLREAGRSGHPVLLKRGLSATIDEWLNAAEYIMSEGNENVILCERGIRTYETSTRNTLDLSAVPVLREKTHLPIIIDPSHATGHFRYVPAMAKAAAACGADGLMIEVHNNPACALSDGAQSLTCERFEHLMKELAPYAALSGRHFSYGS